ncbi:Lrp/AsnC family transcriptional regulator [Streptomyces zagrosensis]|uniref:DNA-binding Lrp family transcriptional regulator n=1 Tax=Streptomyces zagrosensis TaxID=1042984 RepID=A0A7W9Q660_9ACTN|nr:Lrp/AsnC family transcriptional regulator [Streptomyces zagrosensis]MBB5934221.1 DNA-binding Lrp family transcriptional regulator [Streptomyces zagrosensis]
MKTDEFDDLDRQLVHALQLDGRAPFARIAEVLGVSDQTAARRYTRLRTNGQAKVLGLPDAATLGEVVWFVRVQCTPDSSVAVAEALARRMDTSWVSLMSGGTEIAVVVRSGSEQASDALLLRDLPRTPQVVGITAQCMLHQFFGGPQGLVNKSGSLSQRQVELLRAGARGPAPERAAEPASEAAPDVARGTGAAVGPGSESDSPRCAYVVGRPGSYAAGSPSPYVAGSLDPYVAGSSGSYAVGSSDPLADAGLGQGPAPAEQAESAAPATLSDADKRMLAVLGIDGRASIAELAAATAWSPSTVRRRLAELQAHGTLYFDVDYDARLFGLGARAALWMAVPPSALHETGQRIAEHPEIAFCCASTGKHNLFAMVICSDVRALYRYLTTRIAALPAIQQLETLPMIRRVKGPGPVLTGAPTRRRR